MNTPIHTRTRTALAVALGIAASGTPLLAQASTPVRLAAAGAAYAAPAANTTDPSTAASTRLARAEELVKRGRIAQASREYIKVAKMQRAQNVLPSEALWKLAELHNTYGQSPERTANVLASLAADAERLGEPAVEAKALLEATILYNEADMPEKARDCASRLDALLTSPGVSDEVRREAQSRIVRN